ncbi:MAG: cell envelope integrity protein TolA [Bacteroidales bacterium]|nr:cell envelope integrity protein TolA [Bacteroidales bacterium]
MGKKRGIIGSIIFHVLILILFFVLKFSTPLPLPPEEGILVNFGYEDEGAGQYEPENNQEMMQAEAIQSPTSPDDEEEIITQEFEESVAVKENKQNKETKEQTVKQETPKEVNENKPEEKEKQTQVIEAKSLFSNRTKSKSEGITDGDGNQGVETGDPNAKNYGPGGGTGNSGISYNLDGRSPQSLPKPEYNHQEEGKVVVEVKVDQDGKVVYANPGVKGSTTLNQYLLRVAKEAALNARFDKKPEAPAFQKGTITYHFILQ